MDVDQSPETKSTDCSSEEKTNNGASTEHAQILGDTFVEQLIQESALDINQENTPDDQKCERELASQPLVNDEIQVQANSTIVEPENLKNDDVDEIQDDVQNTQEAGCHAFVASPCPEYNFERPEELANSGSLFTAEQYLYSCKWSPDGSCLLTCCADRRLRLFDLPSSLYTLGESQPEKLSDPLQPSLTISENGDVYDYEWYPFMSSWNPQSACFVSASSSAPVHLIDAFTGAVRASYTGYNNVFEVASCFGLGFSYDGVKIFCGYRNMIKIFDIDVPGTTCQTINAKKLNEQTGYVSCIAQNPTMHSLIAAGSFSRTIGLYTLEGDAVCLFKGQRNGLTSLVFSHDGSMLFSGGRMDPEILCWDLRNPGQVLHVLPRVMDTNQRIRISISSDGKHLISGGTDGVIRVWALSDISQKLHTVEPDFKFKAHNDCANGASLNSKLPVMATSSGKRHVPDLNSLLSDNIVRGDTEEPAQLSLQSPPIPTDLQSVDFASVKFEFGHAGRVSFTRQFGKSVVGMAGQSATKTSSKPESKKELSFPVKTYLLLYNGVQVAGWSYVLYKAVIHYLTGGSTDALWSVVGPSLLLFQNAALLEVLNVMLGYVKSPFFITLIQVLSRVSIVSLILSSSPPAQLSLGLPCIVLAWSITEIVRYSFYALNLVNLVPQFLVWCRYTFFYALYPIGVTGELLLYYATQKYTAETGLYTYELPNPLNFTFSFRYCLIAVMLFYIPQFPQLYMYMIRQRKKTLGGSGAPSKKSN
ncbi:Hypothetical protein NTJ_10824 [Nesidiocoris tenuis]|uniref:very-long-chain (3R)-3-hydroxyacyl-CoA dehydratase n=1 Tax=Nesidiocoris tenuis TaxID=355587 RepID=A0ABN7B0Q8_9HEMI|nr:Hypothetical protein NTJ_10824 [Nesidiocoris tenuis]